MPRGQGGFLGNRWISQAQVHQCKSCEQLWRVERNFPDFALLTWHSLRVQFLDPIKIIWTLVSILLEFIYSLCDMPGVSARWEALPPIVQWTSFARQRPQQLCGSFHRNMWWSSKLIRNEFCSINLFTRPHFNETRVSFCDGKVCLVLLLVKKHRILGIPSGNPTQGVLILTLPLVVGYKDLIN